MIEEVKQIILNIDSEGNAKISQFSEVGSAASNTEYIPFYRSNNFPLELRKAVISSGTLKRAYKSIVNILSNSKINFTLAGEPSEEITEVFKTIGLNKDFIKTFFQNIYIYGSFPVVLNFAESESGTILYKLEPASILNYRKFKDKAAYIAAATFTKRNKKLIKYQFEKLPFWSEKAEADTAFKIKEAANNDLTFESVEDYKRLYLVKDSDIFSETYSLPFWYSDSSLSYAKIENDLSTIESNLLNKNFHSEYMIVHYHNSYSDPESGEAKETFKEFIADFTEKMKGAKNSGSIPIVPKSTDSISKESGEIEIIEIPTKDNFQRNLNLDERAQKHLLSANGATISEIFWYLFKK